MFGPDSDRGETDWTPGLDAAPGNVAGEPYLRPGPKIGRNEPCPCGSGKKYKHCHGKLA